MVCFHVQVFPDRGFGVFLLISFEFIFVSGLISGAAALLNAGNRSAL